MRRPGRFALALLLLVSLTRAAAADTRYVDYLYIEANEGGSSGGHTAMRFGAETFHFQQEAGALLRMQRDDSAAFDVLYALLGNRPIHETRIAVSRDTYALLRDTFTRRLLVQTAQYERLDALQDDVALFELWSRRASEPHHAAAGGVAVRAAGYFLPDGFLATAVGAGGSPALAGLRARVAERHGDAFLATRIAALRASLADWQPHAVDTPAPALTLDAYPDFAPTASATYSERLAGLTALEVLAMAPPLRAGTYRVADTLPPLDAHEREILKRFAAALTADLAPLAASPRADFGYPLLLGMARLASIEAALASGYLVVLDGFRIDAPTSPLPGEPKRARYLSALTAFLRPAADRARQELFADGDFREADYTQLETSVNRLLEVAQARRDGTPMRIERGLLLPARPARRDELIAPPLSAGDARSELGRARTAVVDYRDRLAQLYGYNLIARNCVSEIFATVDAAFATAVGDADAAGRESQRRLGGLVRTGGNLNFIPFVSADAVERNYATVAQRTRPSYRQSRVDALAKDQPAWRVRLRESNTLTSTAYRPGAGDSTFLFFTDDAVALRPLLGAANLLIGVADGVLGFATWPVDGGARLGAGWRGAFFSLPELAFFNIRKGTTAWIEPDAVDDGAVRDPLTPGAASPRRSASSP